MPGESGGESSVLPAKLEPDEVTFALPMGIGDLEGGRTWQLRDLATGQVRTIVTWSLSNGVVRAAVQP